MKIRIIWKPGSMRNRLSDAEIEARPQALVDTCAHILWGVDDGPGDLEQSIAMPVVRSSPSSQRSANVIKESPAATPIYCLPLSR